MNVLNFIKRIRNDRETSSKSNHCSSNHTTIRVVRTRLFSTDDYTDNYAVVSQPISSDGPGRIYYQSTYWFGCTVHDVDIPEGAVVELLDRQGTTWLVKPVT